MSYCDPTPVGSTDGLLGGLMNSKQMLSVGLAAVAMSVVLPLEAHADWQDPFRDPTTPYEVDAWNYVLAEQIADQTEVIDAYISWAEATEAGMASSMSEGDEADLEAAYAAKYHDSVFGDGQVHALGTYYCGSDPACQGMELDPEPVAQQKSYYCGPGTVYEMLRRYGYLKAKNTNTALTQWNLAQTGWLKTEQDKATRWSRNIVAPTLNKWRTGSTTGHYVQTGNPGYSKLYNATIWSIDHSYPVAYEVTEPAGGTHLPGHPVNKTIDHWVAGFGYEKKTAYNGALIVDPASSPYVSWGSSVPNMYYYKFTPLAGMMGSHGMVT